MGAVEEEIVAVPSLSRPSLPTRLLRAAVTLVERRARDELRLDTLDVVIRFLGRAHLEGQLRVALFTNAYEQGILALGRAHRGVSASA
jgi:hypothetical protein